MKGLVLCFFTGAILGAFADPTPAPVPTPVPVVVPTPVPPPTIAPPPTPGTVNTCFNVGTAPGTGIVVSNGIPTSLNPAEPLVYTIFYVWLSADCPFDKQNWTVHSISQVPAGLTIRWKQEGVTAVKLSQNHTEVTAVTIEYTCPNVAATTTYNMDANMGVAGYDSVEFKWRKVCLAPIKPPDEGGWSSTGVFFFTVFILTLVFCVIGCGFNYVQRGKTGWEIVPGAMMCQACLAKLSPEQRYTPQMDYDAPVGEENYGASYQTDL